MTKTLHPGDLVDDFYGARVDPDLMAMAGIKASGEYLKSWDAPYNERLFAHGIGICPIFEAGATSALGGASLGKVHGSTAVRQLRAREVPKSCPTGVIFCHDTSAYTVEVPRYFRAAEYEVRSAGYEFSGYIARDPANACIAAGVVFQIIWAPAATAWGGGRHPDASVWQRPSTLFPGTNLSVDMGVVKRQFDVWDGKPDQIIPPPPPDLSKGEIMQGYLTNSETTIAHNWDTNGDGGFGPNVVKWALVFVDGRIHKMQVRPSEYIPGYPEGAKTNAQLMEIPTIPVS